MINFDHPGYAMKLKIISDGTALGTKIVHAETGEVLADVAAISWTVNSDNAYNVANVQLVGIAAEMVGDLKASVQTPNTTTEPLSTPERGDSVIYLNDYLNN